MGVWAIFPFNWALATQGEKTASTNAVANSRVKVERIAVCNIGTSSNWQTKGRAETVMENAESIRERSGIVFAILCEHRDSVKKQAYDDGFPGMEAVIILHAARTEGLFLG